jgi:hypothetical protein
MPCTTLALDRYVSTLTWAKQRASEAIQLWNEGQSLTEAAEAYHAQAVQQAQQQALSLALSGMPTSALDIPFTDPGESKRAAARDMLSRARGQLASVGDMTADAVGRARDKAPQKPSFWERAGEFLGDVSHGVLKGGKDIVNALASVGNAAVQHPGDLLLTAGGIALMAASAGGEGVGVALDATGAGAVAGVPLNAVSAAGITAGAGMAAAGITHIIARNAAGDDHVSPLNSESGSGSGGGSSGSSNAPKEISGLTNMESNKRSGAIAAMACPTLP